MNAIFYGKNILPTQPGSCSTKDAQMYRALVLDELRAEKLLSQLEETALTNDGNIEIMLASMNNSRTTLFIFPCHSVSFHR